MNTSSLTSDCLKELRSYKSGFYKIIVKFIYNKNTLAIKK